MAKCRGRIEDKQQFEYSKLKSSAVGFSASLETPRATCGMTLTSRRWQVKCQQVAFAPEQMEFKLNRREAGNSIRTSVKYRMDPAIDNPIK